MEMEREEAAVDLYDFEIGRFQELLKEDQGYAFKRYGFSLLYSLPPEETFFLKKEMGWKVKQPLDFYNLGTLEALNGNYKDALKHFQKAMDEGCDQPELFFNIALIHEEQENVAEAINFYQQYIDAVEKFDDIPGKLQIELDEAREHVKELQGGGQD